jgi:3-hydroxyacyl-CoA dehydrogenase
VVFNGDMPSIFKGMKVIDGDKTDMRFLDKSNRVIGLKAKGKARKDTSGFVINVIQIA